MPLRVRQIFINILSNAYKFTPLSMELFPWMSAEKQAVDGTALFRFSITDTGIGMKPEYLAQIFTAFSRERTAVWIRRKEPVLEWQSQKGSWI